MTVRNKFEGGPMAIGKLGQRRQVVIPKNICEQLGLQQGDFVEVNHSKGMITIKPKKLVDPDDVLTAEEAATVRKGERQLRQGQYVTLEQLKHDLDRTAGKRSRKTA